ncbi:MAG: protein RepA [Serratia marcescens]|jgi:hypothetical protein|uniref:RepB family plasmid replication initiator protein n=1 Tax=Pantoea sp. PSNIH1 TaxID=1484158 RepID=UPI0011A09355|nr:RepB family plasmid replication initiator protein [Pantoea sp. PSNIH1]MDU3783959.1 protein RepA [Serratia marcescens]MDU3817824.1 protein RepA [Pantoea sp.]
MKSKMLISDVLYADTLKKNKELTVNQHNTVQPVAIMRLGVFVPKPAKNAAISPLVDASELLKGLSLARAEGYDSIQITGPRLDMDTDFKVWIGIVRSFHDHGRQGNSISLKFTEFARNCGFPSKKIDSELRENIHQSLIKIRSKTIAFKRGKTAIAGYITGLLKSGGYDSSEDTIELEADERLWELYYFDHRVLLQQHAIKALPKKEIAQALYTFIESLPAKPQPVSFARIRDRLSLTSLVKEQNRMIKNAVKQLQDIGYLEASVVKEGRENYVLIHKRNPKLKP